MGKKEYLPPIIGKGPYIIEKDFIGIPAIEIAAGILDLRRRGQKLSRFLEFQEWCILNDRLDLRDDDDLERAMRDFENSRRPRSISCYTKKPIKEFTKWDVFERDNYTCQICGARKHLTVDHIHPESKGGKTKMENLQTLCKRCNSKKGSKIIGD